MFPRLDKGLLSTMAHAHKESYDIQQLPWQILQKLPIGQMKIDLGAKDLDSGHKMAECWSGCGYKTRGQ